MLNSSKSWFYLEPDHKTVYEGDSPPSGSTVLVCPGGTISDALAKKHGIEKKLMGDGTTVARDAAGNPVVIKDGKAIVAEVLHEDDEDRKAVEKAAAKEDDDEADVEDNDEKDEPTHDEHGKPVVKSKAIHKDGDVEDKSVDSPHPRRGRPPKAK